MTIEEIFHAYEFNLRHRFVNNADKYREAIIAALKAGQAMRSSILSIDDSKREQAAAAWDAAVREKE